MNMKINRSNRLLVPVLALVTLFYSCYPEQDIEPVDSPDDLPNAVIEPAASNSDNPMEGDTLTYNITVDKLVANDVDFSVVFGDGNEIDSDDIEVIGGTLLQHRFETSISIVLIEDNIPEIDEPLNFSISAEEDITWNWQLGPASEVETLNFALPNVNNPDALTLTFAWDDPDHEMDFDLFVEHATEGSVSAQTTGDNPEIDMGLLNEYPDGTYYIGVDPYDVQDGDINFEVRFGEPNGDVEVFEGVFNVANLDDYQQDTFTAWAWPTYRVLTVVKSGDNYTATFEF